MPRHNNPIPDTHSKKDLLRRIKVNFNQPAKKKKRQLKRELKAKAKFPRPIHNLYPLIRAQSIRYNAKQRLGKGFSLTELKMAHIHKREARTIGISVDHRRQNRDVTALRANVARLKAYKKRLVLFPKRPLSASKLEAIQNPKQEEPKEEAKPGQKKRKTTKIPLTPEKKAKVQARHLARATKKSKAPTRADLEKIGQRKARKDLVPIKRHKPRITVIENPGRIEKKSVFAALRSARALAKTVGVRKIAREKKLAEAAAKA